MEYGVSFLLENGIKYFDEEVEVLGESLICQMLKVAKDAKSSQHASFALMVCFRLFNMFLGTVYL